MDGSRYGYMFGLVLVAIVLVFSFMLKGGKEEPKLVPVRSTAVRLRVWPCEHGPTDSMIPESPRIRKWNSMNGVMQVCDLSELFHSGGIGAWQRSDDRRYMKSVMNDNGRVSSLILGDSPAFRMTTRESHE